MIKDEKTTQCCFTWPFYRKRQPNADYNINIGSSSESTHQRKPNISRIGNSFKIYMGDKPVGRKRDPVGK